MLDQIKERIAHPLAIVAVIWAVFIVETFLPGNINNWGIHPRSISGLVGIVFSPFIHFNLFHILSNTLPLLILGCFLAVSCTVARFWSVTVTIIAIGGLGTWLFSSAGVVIGASGLVFGYWSFLIANAYFRRSIVSIVVAFVTLVLYSGMFFSLFAYKPYISFAGHLCGAIAGVVAAFLLARNGSNRD